MFQCFVEERCFVSARNFEVWLPFAPSFLFIYARVGHYICIFTTLGYVV